MRKLLVVLVVGAPALGAGPAVAAPDFSPGSVSARGTVSGGSAGPVQFSAANACDAPASTKPFIVKWGTTTFTKTSVSTVSCTDDAGVNPNPASGFDTQTGTAAGKLQNGAAATVIWKFVDGGPDRVELTVKNGGGTTILTVASQTPAALSGTPGGVWTSAPATRADLTLLLDDLTDPVDLNTDFTYRTRISNSGPDTAPATRIRLEVPAGVVITAGPAGATCTIAAGGHSADCLVGDVPNSPALTTYDFTAHATAQGIHTATARALSRAVDPNADNNSQTENTLAGPIADTVVGSITANITRTLNFAGESALGDVIADATLVSGASAGAQIAFVNPGGLRADLIFANQDAGEAAGEVTYNELYQVQPLQNKVVVQTFTGAQIRSLLEQQFDISGFNRRILQVSGGFSFSYDSTLPPGARVSSMSLNGLPIDAAASYRVATDSFLAGGGDGFTVFTQGTAAVTGETDLDAALGYFGSYSPVSPGPQNRIIRFG